MNILHHLHYYNNRSNDSVRGHAQLLCTSHGNNGSWDNFYPFVAVKKEDNFGDCFVIYTTVHNCSDNFRKPPESF